MKILKLLYESKFRNSDHINSLVYKYSDGSIKGPKFITIEKGTSGTLMSWSSTNKNLLNTINKKVFNGTGKVVLWKKGSADYILTIQMNDMLK